MQIFKRRGFASYTKIDIASTKCSLIELFERRVSLPLFPRIHQHPDMAEGGNAKDKEGTIMKRHHLFEFGDQQWFPRTLRDASTSYLHFISRAFRFHEGIEPIIEKVTNRCRSNTIVDLCSGGTGPVLDITESLHRRDHDIQVVLTDKFPNLLAFQQAQAAHPEYVEYRPAAIDVLAVPPELKGVRTMINAFHHFRPESARRILASAAEAQQGIVILEMSERRLLNVLSFIPIFIVVLMTIPFLRPFRWSWLPFTHLIPIIPLTIAWDGVVSHLRSYSPDELRALASEHTNGYVWEVVRKQVGKNPITGLIGFPEVRV